MFALHPFNTFLDMEFLFFQTANGRIIARNMFQLALKSFFKLGVTSLQRG